jgi:UDPglucose 6-dehydrogenase
LFALSNTFDLVKERLITMIPDIPLLSPAAEAEDHVLLDASTAPTTPEGSLSFSPVLRAARDVDIGGYESGVAHHGRSRNSHQSLGLTLSNAASAQQIRAVRNICCVGAGYVGMAIKCYNYVKF